MATDQSHQSQPELHKVLILRPLPFFTLYEHLFSSRFNLLKAYESPLPLREFLLAHAQSVEALLVYARTPVDSGVIRLLPSLRIISSTSAGVDNIDLEECRRRGIKVTNAGEVYSENVADLAVGLLIDVVRKISASDRYVREGSWKTKGSYPLGFKLGGMRIGIVGLGSIGLEVAKRLEAFGCKISYNSRKKKPFVSYDFYPDVHQLATHSDALIICCDLNDQTRHMINKEVFLALGKEGVIVNIARGAVVDPREMVRCLVEGEIGGAGLDVFEGEPKVPEELFGLENVVLSPHRAVFTPEIWKDVSQLAIGNLEALFSGKPLLSPVKNEGTS